MLVRCSVCLFICEINGPQMSKQYVSIGRISWSKSLYVRCIFNLTSNVDFCTANIAFLALSLRYVIALVKFTYSSIVIPR